MATQEQRVRQRIRELRLERRFTQQDVADRMKSLGREMHRSAIAKIETLEWQQGGISDIETGQRVLRVSELFDLATVLGVTPAFLLTGEGARTDETLDALWRRVEALEAIRERYDAICEITGGGS